MEVSRKQGLGLFRRFRCPMGLAGGRQGERGHSGAGHLGSHLGQGSPGERMSAGLS